MNSPAMFGNCTPLTTVPGPCLLAKAPSLSEMVRADAGGPASRIPRTQQINASLCALMLLLPRRASVRAARLLVSDPVEVNQLLPVAGKHRGYGRACSQTAAARDDCAANLLEPAVLARVAQLLAVVGNVGPIERYAGPTPVERDRLVADPDLAQVPDLRDDLTRLVVARHPERDQRRGVLLLPGVAVARQPVVHVGLGERTGGRWRLAGQRRG